MVLAASGLSSLIVGGCSRRTQPGTTQRLQGTKEDGDPLWSPESKAFLIAFPADAQMAGDQIYPAWLRGHGADGVEALRSQCPNDGVVVSWCRGDRFFSCPGCLSVFTRYGDYVSGPSPRGLDRYGLSISKTNDVVIDRSVVRPGPPHGIALGPFIEPGTPCREARA